MKTAFAQKVKCDIKSGLELALKTNANSTGCFIIYQPKAPKALQSFKRIK